MPTHYVMTTKAGDEPFTFKTDDEAEVKVAMERFNDLVRTQKMWASTTGQDGQPRRLLKTFDPTVDAIFMKQVIGG